jgi:hypothetical protein
VADPNALEGGPDALELWNEEDLDELLP